MRKLEFKFFLFVLLICLNTSIFAQQVQFQPLPIDPKVKYGKLENGLTYYIRSNQQPKNRADFYIVQNVGAILENDDQNGLAHFLEHMAFNGTKNFPGKKIIEYFESVGVKFGANINAYTSLDETVYHLSNVPTNRESIIDSALLVLHDWSNAISLEESEIEAERGVILEEWRQGASADRRMWKESNKQKFPGSQYAKRDVIGDTAVIKHFTPEALRDYYKKWYRPDQQAIIVVGDVDVNKIEEKIIELFSNIKKPENTPERPIYPIYDNKEPIISIVTDPEARMTRVELIYKHDKLPAEIKLSINGYLVNVINSLISNMMQNRFEEITMQPDAPFVAGYATYGEMVKSKDAFYLVVVPKEGSETEGIKSVLIEAEKVKRFGFNHSELERAKADLAKMIEKQYNEKDNQKNESYVREYMNHFLNQDPIPGIEWEYETIKMILPQINADMVNQLAKSYVTDTNMIVSILAPQKPTVVLPSKEEIRQIIEEVKKTELTAKLDEKIDKPLIEKMPKPGKIKKVSKNDILGTTEWILSNGAKVILKPTTFKKDEILFNAYSTGGLSKVENIEDLPSAEFATEVVNNNGLSNFNQIELKKLLSGKIASVSPYIDNYEEGFSGNSSVSDFETMLQLLYLHFTALRKDDNAFTALMNNYKAFLANSENNPDKAFSDSVKLMLSNHSPRTVLLNMKTLEKVNQDKALEIFAERFSDPADFTFVFTGNVDPNDKTVVNAINTFIGGIKSKGKKESFTDDNVRLPVGRAINHFSREMQVKKVSNCIVYSGNLNFNMNNRTNMNAIGNILNIRYLESVREKEGGSYGVGVAGNLRNRPIEQAMLFIQFDTNIEKQNKLMDIIHSEIDTIISKGPKAEDLQKVKETMMKKYEEDLQENKWWQSAIKNYYFNKLNVVNDYLPSVQALTSESIQKTLKTIVDQGNIMEIVMKPKE
jgi:zinc protease